MVCRPRWSSGQGVAAFAVCRKAYGFAGRPLLSVWAPCPFLRLMPSTGTPANRHKDGPRGPHKPARGSREERVTLHRRTGQFWRPFPSASAHDEAG